MNRPPQFTDRRDLGIEKAQRLKHVVFEIQSTAEQSRPSNALFCTPMFEAPLIEAEARTAFIVKDLVEAVVDHRCIHESLDDVLPFLAKPAVDFCINRHPLPLHATYRGHVPSSI